MTVPVVRFSVVGEYTHEAVAPSNVASGRRYTVIYDGNCGVCSRSVKLLTKWDRNHDLEIFRRKLRESASDFRGFRRALTSNQFR